MYTAEARKFDWIITSGGCEEMNTKEVSQLTLNATFQRSQLSHCAQ